MKRISVVGNGYVGTVAAACLAQVGHQVVGLEIDPWKLSLLRHGELPFFEPGLEDLLRTQIEAGRLSFTDSPFEAMEASDAVFLCVGTPQGGDGRPDMRAFYSAAAAIAGALRHHHVLVNKSTVPVGTGRMLAAVVEDALPPAVAARRPFSIVSCPEFLREGNAIDDFLRPHRLVIGGDDAAAIDEVVEVYRPILEQSYPGGSQLVRPALVRTSLVNAEMVKYASNAFLATKISFINEIANICELVDADVTVVSTAMGLDPRIGTQFLNAGAGWGGSCFGKDLHGLVGLASDHGYQPQLLEATLTVNRRQRWSIMEKLSSHLPSLGGKRVALLGLAFKAGTDDLRDAPALDIAGWLLSAGATVAAHDPMVTRVETLPDLQMSETPYASAAGADALVVLTDWPEYRHLDLTALAGAMSGNILVDARNLLDAGAAGRAGFVYEGIGRSSGEPGHKGGLRTIRLEASPALLGNGNGNGNGHVAANGNGLHTFDLLPRRNGNGHLPLDAPAPGNGNGHQRRDADQPLPS